jgi:hypothetical protein
MRLFAAFLLAAPVSWYSLKYICAWLDSILYVAPFGLSAVSCVIAMLAGLYVLNVLVLRKTINWLTR